MHNTSSILYSRLIVLQNKIALFIILLGIWLVMSGIFTPFIIGLGVSSCLLSVFIYSLLNKNINNSLKISAISVIWGLFTYSFWLLKEIFVSSWDVTVKIWQLEPDISPQMDWVNTSLKNDVSMTILATSITLTPGTVTVDVAKDGSFLIHALSKKSLDDLRSGAMVERVIKVMR